MKNLKLLSAIALIGIFFFTACEKDDSLNEVRKDDNMTKEDVVTYN